MMAVAFQAEMVCKCRGQPGPPQDPLGNCPESQPQPARHTWFEGASCVLDRMGVTSASGQRQTWGLSDMSGRPESSGGAA